MAWSDATPSTTCRDVLRADPYSPLAQRGWYAHPRMRRRREARSRTLELHSDSRFSSQREYTAHHRRCDGSHAPRRSSRSYDEAGDGSWNLDVRRCESDARRFVGWAVDNRMHVWVWHSWNSLYRRHDSVRRWRQYDCWRDAAGDETWRYHGLRVDANQPVSGVDVRHSPHLRRSVQAPRDG